MLSYGYIDAYPTSLFNLPYEKFLGLLLTI